MTNAPLWVWLALLAVCASCGWVIAAVEWRRAGRRAAWWEQAARAAQAEARGWRALAGPDAPVLGKRTVVAPQYHAPRAG